MLRVSLLAALVSIRLALSSVQKCSVTELDLVGVKEPKSCVTRSNRLGYQDSDTDTDTDTDPDPDPLVF